MSEKTYVKVSAIYKINDNGGVGTSEATATLDVVKLMMEADFVKVYNTTILVKAVEVTDNGDVNFYGEEINEQSKEGYILSE